MTARAAERMLLIGLDVGDGPLIRQWAAEGHLPVLAALIAQGEWAWLSTTADTLHVSAWPSIYTGALPGEHGVYFTFQPRAGHQGWLKFSGDQYGCPTFWNLLSAGGVRCVVFDAPYTHPQASSTALQVFEWGTWAHHWTPMSIPPDLSGRLTRACGRYPLGLEALDLGLRPLDADEIGPRLTSAARAKTDAALWLMRRQPWDLFFVVFGETHPAAHYCWSRSDDGARGQARLLPVYQEIDRGIGRLLAEAGSNIAVGVISGDGAGPNYTGWHLLPTVLQRLGFLTVRGGTAGADGPSRRAGRDGVRTLRDAVPPGLRKAVARRLPDWLRHRLALRVDMAGLDWSRTRAYCLPTDLEGCVRLNVTGREPEGIVADGADYRRACDDLQAALSALTNPRTGRRAVREVVRIDDRFPGPRRHALPDLVVVWEGDAPVTDLASAAVGVVTGASPDGRPGTHAPHAFLLGAGGPGFHGRLAHTGHVCGIASGILDHFGIPRPDHLLRGPRAVATAPGA